MFCNSCFESLSDTVAVCQSCDATHYCSAQCQKIDWSGVGGHNKNCSKIGFPFANVTEFIQSSAGLQELFKKTKWRHILETKNYNLVPAINNVLEFSNMLADYKSTSDAEKTSSALAPSPMLQALFERANRVAQEFLKQLRKYLESVLGSAQLYANAAFQTLAQYLRQFGSILSGAANLVATPIIWVFDQLWNGFKKYVITPIYEQIAKLFDWIGGVLSIRTAHEINTPYEKTAGLCAYAFWIMKQPKITNDDSRTVASTILQHVSSTSSSYKSDVMGLFQKLDLVSKAPKFRKVEDAYRMVVQTLTKIMHSMNYLVTTLLTAFVTGPALKFFEPIANVSQHNSKESLTLEQTKESIDFISAHALEQDQLLNNEMQKAFTAYMASTGANSTTIGNFWNTCYQQGTLVKVLGQVMGWARAQWNYEEYSSDLELPSLATDETAKHYDRLQKLAVLLTYRKAVFMKEGTTFDSTPLDTTEEEHYDRCHYLASNFETPSFVTYIVYKTLLPPNGLLNPKQEMQVGVAIGALLAAAISLFSAIFVTDMVAGLPKYAWNRLAALPEKASDAAHVSFLRFSDMFVPGYSDTYTVESSTLTLLQTCYADGSPRLDEMLGNKKLYQIYQKSYNTPEDTYSALLAQHDNAAYKWVNFHSKLPVYNATDENFKATLPATVHNINFNPCWALLSPSDEHAENMAKALLKYRQKLFGMGFPVQKHPWFRDVSATLQLFDQVQQRSNRFYFSGDRTYWNALKDEVEIKWNISKMNASQIMLAQSVVGEYFEPVPRYLAFWDEILSYFHEEEPLDAPEVPAVGVTWLTGYSVISFAKYLYHGNRTALWEELQPQKDAMESMAFGTASFLIQTLNFILKQPLTSLLVAIIQAALQRSPSKLLSAFAKNTFITSVARYGLLLFAIPLKEDYSFKSIIRTLMRESLSSTEILLSGSVTLAATVVFGVWLSERFRTDPRLSRLKKETPQEKAQREEQLHRIQQNSDRTTEVNLRRQNQFNTRTSLLADIQNEYVRRRT